MPELERLHRDAERTGVAVVGLSIDGADVDGVRATLAGNGVTYPSLLTDPPGLAPLVGDGEVRIPLVLLVDRERRVTDVFSGWSTKTRERLASAVGAATDPTN
jgi:hypothetical protein